MIAGPGTLGVRVEDQHQLGPNHFDIGFLVNRLRDDIPVLWDCVAGMGKTCPEVVDWAVRTWVRSTLPVMLELSAQDGTFADHFGPDDPEGCPGWHVIHGPVLAFGVGSAPDELQAWTLENPLLPILGPLVVGAFSRPELNGVKIVFGFGSEDTSEVRINGVCNKEASNCLRSLQWPRAKDLAFARCYYLFVHGHQEVIQ